MSSGFVETTTLPTFNEAYQSTIHSKIHDHVFDDFLVVQIDRDTTLGLSNTSQTGTNPVITHIFSPSMIPTLENPGQLQEEAYSLLPTDIAKLCFPDNALELPRGSCNSFDATNYTFVLTDKNGKRSYGFCRRFIPFDSGLKYPIVLCFISSYHLPVLFNQVLEILQIRWCLSTATVFSFLHAFSFVPQSLLSTIDHSRLNDPIIANTNQSLHALRKKAKTVPVPKLLSINIDPSNIAALNAKYRARYEKTHPELEYDECQITTDYVNFPDTDPTFFLPSSYVFPLTPSSVSFSLTDAPLDVLYRCLSPQSLAQVFSAVLTEQRLLFVSKHLTVLTEASLAAVSLIRPFNWQHLFIPVLPSTMAAIATTPVPFVIGVRPSTLEAITMHTLDQVIVVDLDKDQISLIGTFNQATQFKFPLPPILGEKLVTQLKKLSRKTASAGALAECFLSFIIVLLSAGRWDKIWVSVPAPMNVTEVGSHPARKITISNIPQVMQLDITSFIPPIDTKAHEIHTFLLLVSQSQFFYTFMCHQKQRLIAYYTEVKFDVTKMKTEGTINPAQRQPLPTSLSSSSSEDDSPHPLDEWAAELDEETIPTILRDVATRAGSFIELPKPPTVTRATQMLEQATRKAAYEAAFTVPERIIAECITNKNFPVVASYTGIIKRLHNIAINSYVSGNSVVAQGQEEVRKMVNLFSSNEHVFDSTHPPETLMNEHRGLHINRENIKKNFERNVLSFDQSCFDTIVSSYKLLNLCVNAEGVVTHDRDSSVHDNLTEYVQVMCQLSLDSRYCDVIIDLLTTKLYDRKKSWKYLAQSLLLLDCFIQRGNERITAWFGRVNNLELVKSLQLYSNKDSNAQKIIRSLSFRCYIHLTSLFDLKTIRFYNSGMDEQWFTITNDMIINLENNKKTPPKSKFPTDSDFIPHPLPPLVQTKYSELITDISKAPSWKITSYRHQSLNDGGLTALIPDFMSCHHTVMSHSAPMVTSGTVSQEEMDLMRDIFGDSVINPPPHPTSIKITLQKDTYRDVDGELKPLSSRPIVKPPPTSFSNTSAIVDSNHFAAPPPSSASAPIPPSKPIRRGDRISICNNTTLVRNPHPIAPSRQFDTDDVDLTSPEAYFIPPPQINVNRPKLPETPSSPSISVINPNLFFSQNK